MQKYQNAIQDVQGNAVASATVTVYVYGTLTPATIYSDNGLTVIPSSQVTTDSDGQFYFYADNGRYTLSVMATGFAQEQFSDVSLFDQADAGIASVKDYGAVGNGTTDDTAAIQAGIDAVSAAGGGTLLFPAGTYGISASASSVGPSGLAHGLLVQGSVCLVGQGQTTVIKRIGATSFHLINVRSPNGAEIRNLRIDGQATALPIAPTATSNLGAGILVESLTSTETKNVVIDTVWIDDVLGYGVGLEWGHQRGATIRNIFVDGCGADGMDIKRFTANNFDAFAIVVDNFRVTNFGRLATDAAQTGLDIRGYCTVSNIHVYGAWGTYARTGIRLRGGIATDNSLGAQRSNLVNYYVDRSSGGEATTYGLEVNADDTSTVNGTVSNCTIGVTHFHIGTATSVANVSHANVKAFSCSYGFRTESAANNVAFVSCEAKSNTDAGFLIEGANARIVAAICDLNSVYHIRTQATATNTKVVFASYSGSPSGGNFYDLGTGTLRVEADGVQFGTESFKAINSGTKAFEIGTAAGDSYISVTRQTGSALVYANSDTASNVDLSLSPKGSGYHTFSNARTAATVGSAGAASALPATPTGYLRVKIAGVVKKIPYYED